MNRQCYRIKSSKLVALFLTATALQFVSLGSGFLQAMAQTPTETPKACTEIVAPLTADEQAYAKTAWQYFVNNYQEKTGFVNSTAGYPSGTLWDMANYLMALNSVRWLNIIDQGEFDSRINKFLTSLNGLKLFEDSLPNKVYNAATGEMTDYGNNPKPRGIGWSALDVGRMLSAFYIIRTCHPKYADWLNGIVAKWKLDRSIKDGELTGAVVLPDDKTLLVQEGRLGYEQYSARGYELWGFHPDKAINVEPLKFVEVEKLKIPVDTRNYQTSGANNYVVSESYVLDGIEFGLQGYLQDYAASVFDAQRRHFESTGELTAVSEDNIDQAPYFLYNTLFANEVTWAVITDENKPYPKLRSLSTKAAFGWRYLYPENPYAQKIFEVAKTMRSPDNGGFYAGLYQETKQPNKILTANTNGLILEILYFKARGSRPLISSSQLTFGAAPPTGNNLIATNPSLVSPATTTLKPPTTTATAPAPTPTVTAPTPTPSTAPTPTAPATPAPIALVVAPIPPVVIPNPSFLPKLARPLKVQERRYAEAAWNYFKAYYQSNTGLVQDRYDFKGVTLWGLGDYLAALHAARSLNIISAEEFDQRTRMLLGALTKLPLYDKELPSRSYDIRTLQPIDYGGNPVPQGTGWSSLDIGHLLSALYNLKSNHTEYTDAVDKIVLNWSYMRIVRDRMLYSAVVKTSDNQQNQDTANNYNLSLFYPEIRLGYEEYAARGFQLWGFDVDRSAVGTEYKTAPVEGVNVPTQRIQLGVKGEPNKYTVSDPFLVYGLEFGFDPKMRQLFDPIRLAQSERYHRTGIFTAGGTTISNRPPYVIHNTVIAGTEPWATLTDDGKNIPEDRMVRTATAFAIHALYPEDAYANELMQAVTDLHDPLLGYYEGFYEKTGSSVRSFTSSTNSLILQSLLYLATNQQPLVRLNTDMDSPWWQAIAKGNSGRGLPFTPTQKTRLITDTSGSYWGTVGNNTTPLSQIPPILMAMKPPTASPPPAPIQGFTAPIISPLPTVEGTNTSRDTSGSFPTREEGGLGYAAKPRLRKQANLVAAQRAWDYFDRNWNSQTGLVNAADNNPVTTLWDIGSAILGIDAARQLGLIGAEQYSSKINQMLQNIEKLPKQANNLPYNSYSTTTAQPIELQTSKSDLVGISRLLLALYVWKIHYPEYSSRINHIVAGWNLLELAKGGMLQGGYEQYVANSLKLWNIALPVALNQENMELQGERDNPINSITNAPNLLLALELGLPEAVKAQTLNTLKAQTQSSYFEFYVASTNNPPWLAKTSDKAETKLSFLSTPAAFVLESLLPDDPYAKTLRNLVQNLTAPNRGYLSGLYKNAQEGDNDSINLNTNAIVLESVLYQTRDARPLAF